MTLKVFVYFLVPLARVSLNMVSQLGMWDVKCLTPIDSIGLLSTGATGGVET